MKKINLCIVFKELPELQFSVRIYFLTWLQVSHHPPVSAFYVTNRQDGFCISASIFAKSKFYGMDHQCKYLDPRMLNMPAVYLLK